MSTKHNNNIRVMCRFRPMNELEQSKNGTIIYKLLKKNGTMIEHPDKIHHPQPMPFHFDKIFDAKAAQIEVFEEAALPLIDNIFEGYNATIFAYGQTGSGKTHTMMGDMIKTEMHPRHGIIPRVVREIWNRIVHASSNYEFELKVSFLEIYNEQIYDLLSTDGYVSNRNNKKGRRKKKKREKLIIREFSDQVFVENLNEIYVRDQNELFDLIKSANKHRISAETNMNRSSSRSHAVLTIILGQEDMQTGNSKKSKFCLVDLAGSEKVGKTQAKGIRLKEATSINKSLTTLGTCMNKLADNISKNVSNHIPFRESVLTRLLSDSLGGNCKTTLMINTSPCSYNVEETISTLRFGERAKKIKTKARINQIKTPQQYRKELQIAQTEIMKLYRIIESCSEDITNAFKGTLNIDQSKSYKHLLELKKYTLNILKGKGSKTSLLANILPDLTNLQSLKKTQTVKKFQKKQLLIRQTQTNPQLNANIKSISPKQSIIITPNQKFDPTSKFALTRARNGSFEDLNIDEPIKLVRDKSKKKINPLMKKTSKKDFRNTLTNSANPAFLPPTFQPDMFNVSGLNIIKSQMDDGLSIGQMMHRDEESDFTDYNSELEHLGIMSPAAISDTQSDTSQVDSYNPYFTYENNNSLAELSMEFTDFQEEELPSNFFDMNFEQRLQFAKSKRIDPLLIEYRYEISRKVDWMCWDSGDEDIESDEDIKKQKRDELYRNIDHNHQKNLMLCRLIRTKTQSYCSRLDIEKSKYQSLSAQYRAKNEENSKLMQQNTNLEKLYERTENDKRELTKNIKVLKRELGEKKKELSKLEKQLTLKLNELNIERRNQIDFSNDKTSMLRKTIHEKYGRKYMKKIERDIIKNRGKDINLRFDELARAFNEQSSKYCDLEEIIEKSKRQFAKYEQLMRQKDAEENALLEEIRNEDLIRKELILSHNLEIKKIHENMKKNKKSADMWKRRAFVYKNAVNSLMEEAEFNNLNDYSDDSTNSGGDKPTLHLDLPTLTKNKLPTLKSLSPKSMAKSLKHEQDNTWVKYRKSRQSITCKEQVITHKKRGRIKDKYPISKRTNDAFYMTPSQKTALTSVKMKIRGGGGSDEDVYKTPIRTHTHTHPPTKRSIRQLNGSLPPPSNIAARHSGGGGGYSSDEYNISLDKSRLDMPVAIGMDSLVRNRSIDMDNIDQSPSLNFMGAYVPGGASPRGGTNSNFKKRATSPLPPPQRAQVQKHQYNINDNDSDNYDDDEFENDGYNADVILATKKEQFTSPAGSFFSKIKHTANDDDDDDNKYNYNYNRKQKPKPKPKPKPKRKAVSIPEPTGYSDNDEFDGGFSDTDNYTDDNIPSYNASLYNMNSRGSQRNLLAKSNKKGKLRMSVTEHNFD